MDGGEVHAPVEAGEHDGIQTIGLAVVTGSPWDEGRCNGFTVEAVIGEDALEDEAGAGGFVAGPDRAMIGQAAEEPTDFHQVGG